MNRIKTDNINKIKHAALYCRLSQDDGSAGESMSISSQKLILENHAKSVGIHNYEFYVDDGYSGTNFNRPAFQKMITDIENGKIDCVVTKDLSRLGRNYIESGAFIEVFFPKHNVRYISVNDGVDSVNSYGMDITPFKNILNEFYSRDISRKIISAKNIRASQGKFMGNTAPFGYKKDPDDKNHLIIDEVTAPTIRRIYELALENKGNNRIIKVLFDERRPKPSYYKQELFGKMSLDDDATFDWKFTPVMRILRNPVYKGGMWVKTCTKSHFKQASRGYIRIADREIVEDVHEAIISKELWQAVQDNIDSHSKYKPNLNNVDNMFRGKLICDTCGHTLLMRTENKLKRPVLEKTHYECTTYRRRGVKFCSSHKMMYLDIYDILLTDIKKQAKEFMKDRDKFIDKLAGKFEEQSEKTSVKLKAKLEKKQKRYDEIDNMFIKVYDDFLKGMFDEEKFNLISSNYTNEQKTLKEEIKKIQEELELKNAEEENIDSFISIIENYAKIKELNSTIISTLVDKVIISDPEVINGEKTQKINIIYKFVGSIG